MQEKNPQQETSNPEFDTLVNGITDIANALCKRKGWQNVIRTSDTRIVLMSYGLLINQQEKENQANSRSKAKS